MKKGFAIFYIIIIYIGGEIMERQPKHDTGNINKTPNKPVQPGRVHTYDKSNGIGQNPPPSDAKPGFPTRR
jgi:hypothetical protein